MGIDQMQQELIQSNEYLRIQIWILGGAIVVILSIASLFARSAWMDMRAMLGDHETRLRKVETHTSVLVDRSKLSKA